MTSATARNLLPCKLELGGKGAALVFDDVDVADTAAIQAACEAWDRGEPETAGPLVGEAVTLARELRCAGATLSPSRNWWD